MVRVLPSRLAHLLVKSGGRSWKVWGICQVTCAVVSQLHLVQLWSGVEGGCVPGLMLACCHPPSHKVIHVTSKTMTPLKLVHSRKAVLGTRCVLWRAGCCRWSHSLPSGWHQPLPATTLSMASGLASVAASPSYRMMCLWRLSCRFQPTNSGWHPTLPAVRGIAVP